MNASSSYREIETSLNESADALEGLISIVIALADTEEAQKLPTIEQTSLALTFALAECARRISTAACELEKAAMA